VVFSNLGTPEGPDPKALGRYLGEFLMDKHVIQLPWFFRALLVKGIIVPFRKSKSAANYQKVWTSEGSPLLVETKKAAMALQKKLGHDYKVVVAMRYGEPGFKRAHYELKDCEKIIFFPQYPQYADSTVKTGLEKFEQYFEQENAKVIEPYYDDPRFIKAYGDFLKTQGLPQAGEHLLMSFHGLPESHLFKTDPTGQHCLRVDNCCEKAPAEVLKTCYRAQCLKTAQLLSNELGLSSQDYSLSFQSRLGRQKWLEPSTENKLKELAEKGHKKVSVICPGFSVDGLETLEEIALGGKECFLAAGGESFRFVPCLNDDDHWIEACANMIRKA
jgi:ferrochelatase